MTLVVGQRVFWEGVVGGRFLDRGDKSQIDAMDLKHQGGIQVMLCFLRT